MRRDDHGRQIWMSAPVCARNGALFHPSIAVFCDWQGFMAMMVHFSDNLAQSEFFKTDSTRARIVLTSQQARDVFNLKNKHGFPSANAACIFLAAKYHVSSKAIRDIWAGRSWLSATFEMWDENERPARRIIGRPKGKKDSKPRDTKSIRSCNPPNIEGQDSRIRISALTDTVEIFDLEYV